MVGPAIIELSDIVAMLEVEESLALEDDEEESVAEVIVGPAIIELSEDVLV
jgi:hypothetical protein